MRELSRKEEYQRAIIEFKNDLFKECRGNLTDLFEACIDETFLSQHRRDVLQMLDGPIDGLSSATFTSIELFPTDEYTRLWDAIFDVPVTTRDDERRITRIFQSACQSGKHFAEIIPDKHIKLSDSLRAQLFKSAAKNGLTELFLRIGAPTPQSGQQLSSYCKKGRFRAALELVKAGHNPLTACSNVESALLISLSQCPCDQLAKLLEAMVSQIDSLQSADTTNRDNLTNHLRDIIPLLPKSTSCLKAFPAAQMDPKLLLLLTQVLCPTGFNSRADWLAQAAATQQDLDLLESLVESLPERQIAKMHYAIHPSHSKEVTSFFVKHLSKLSRSLWLDVLRSKDSDLLRSVLETRKFIIDQDTTTQNETWEHAVGLSYEGLKLLCDYGAELNWVDTRSFVSPLTRAISKISPESPEWLKMAQSFYRLGAKTALQLSPPQNTLIFLESLNSLSSLKLSEKEKRGIWVSAILKGRTELVSRLVRETDIQVNQPISEELGNALFLAAEDLTEKMLGCLVALGIDLHARDCHGNTALDQQMAQQPYFSEAAIPVIALLVHKGVHFSIATTKERKQTFFGYLLQVMKLAYPNLVLPASRYLPKGGLTAEITEFLLVNKQWDALENAVLASCHLANSHSTGQAPNHLAFHNIILELFWSAIDADAELAHRLIKQESRLLGIGGDASTPSPFTMPQTWLQMAVISGAKNAVISTLVKAGASMMRIGSVRGYSPYHLSICYRNQELLELFLKTASLEELKSTTYDGNTAVHLAASFFPPVIAMLVGKGLSVEALNADGRSPLQVACVRGAEESVKILVELGANVQTENTPTPLTLVKQCLRKLESGDASAPAGASIAGQTNLQLLLKKEIGKLAGATWTAINEDPFFEGKVGKRAGRLHKHPSKNLSQFRLEANKDCGVKLFFVDANQTPATRTLYGTAGQIKQEVISIIQDQVVAPLLEKSFPNLLRGPDWKCSRGDFLPRTGTGIARRRVLLQLSNQNFDVTMHHLDPDTYEPQATPLKGVTARKEIRRIAKEKRDEIARRAAELSPPITNPFPKSDFFRQFEVIGAGQDLSQALKPQSKTRYAFVFPVDTSRFAAHVVIVRPNGRQVEVPVWGNAPWAERQVIKRNLTDLSQEIAERCRHPYIIAIEADQELPQGFAATGIALQPVPKSQSIRIISFDLKTGSRRIDLLDSKALQMDPEELSQHCLRINKSQNEEVGRNRIRLSNCQDLFLWNQLVCFTDPFLRCSVGIYEPCLARDRLEWARRIYVRRCEMTPLLNFCANLKVAAKPAMLPLNFSIMTDQGAYAVATPYGPYLSEINCRLDDRSPLISFSANGDETHVYFRYTHGLVRIVVSEMSEAGIFKALVLAEAAQEICQAHPFTAHGMKLVGVLPEFQLAEPPEGIELDWLRSQSRVIHYEHEDLRDDSSFRSPEDIPDGIETLLKNLREKNVFGVATSEPEYFDRLEKMLKHIVLHLQQQPEEQSAKIGRLSISAVGNHCGARWDGEITAIYNEITGQELSSDLEQWILSKIDDLKISSAELITGKTGSGDPHESGLLKRSAKEVGLVFPKRAGGNQWDPWTGKTSFRTEAEARVAFFTEYNPIEVIDHVRREINQALPADYSDPGPEADKQTALVLFLSEILRQRAEACLPPEIQARVSSINFDCEAALSRCRKDIQSLELTAECDAKKQGLQELRSRMELLVEERDKAKSPYLTEVMNDQFRQFDDEEVFWELTSEGALQVLIHLRILEP